MHFPPPHAGDGASDPLLLDAAAWIAQLHGDGQDVLLYPISRLQRRLRIGYHRTCALMDALAQRGAWTIAFGADGTRHALLHPGAPA
jgi:DNA segregation ATPase FtsK/SpoIIIE-like protein